MSGRAKQIKKPRPPFTIRVNASTGLTVYSFRSKEEYVKWQAQQCEAAEKFVKEYKQKY